jgi:mRNA-capping enzyme
MIIQYLVDKNDCALDAAILSFSNARSPGLFYPPYVHDLKMKFENLSLSEAIRSVRIDNFPSWVKLPQTSAPSTPSSPFIAPIGSPRAKRAKEAVFYPSLGMNALRVKESHFDPLASSCCRLSDVQRIDELLPPFKTLDTAYISSIGGWQSFPQDLLVTWCTQPQGKRVVVLALRSGVFFFAKSDKDIVCHNILNVGFFQKKDSSQKLDKTVFCGEVVTDEVEGAMIPRLLVTDLICLQGKNIKSLPLTKRLSLLNSEVVEPWKNSLGSKSSALRVRLKSFSSVKEINKLLNVVIPGLPHPSSGLVFVPESLSASTLSWNPEQSDVAASDLNFTA